MLEDNSKSVPNRIVIKAIDLWPGDVVLVRKPGLQFSQFERIVSIRPACDRFLFVGFSTFEVLALMDDETTVKIFGRTK